MFIKRYDRVKILLQCNLIYEFIILEEYDNRYDVYNIKLDRKEILLKKRIKDVIRIWR